MQLGAEVVKEGRVLIETRTIENISNNIRSGVRILEGIRDRLLGPKADPPMQKLTTAVPAPKSELDRLADAVSDLRCLDKDLEDVVCRLRDL